MEELDCSICRSKIGRPRGNNVEHLACLDGTSLLHLPVMASLRRNALKGLLNGKSIFLLRLDTVLGLTRVPHSASVSTSRPLLRSPP